uniref:Uncharacterized protein n=1 Tax=Arundo donax TaxID=35708 RepID=A0A0A9D7X0_ARUDO
MAARSGPLRLRPSNAQEEAGCIVGDKPAEPVAVAGGGGDKAPAGTGLWRLSDEEVQWVLSQERGYLTPGVVSPEGAEAVNSVSDSFVEYQAWMRREYEANGGVVLVDDEFVARREEDRLWMEEQLAGLSEDGTDFAGWNISDRLSDFYESDGEEREEVVQELNTN